MALGTYAIGELGQLWMYVVRTEAVAVTQDGFIWVLQHVHIKIWVRSPTV